MQSLLYGLNDRYVSSFLVPAAVAMTAAFVLTCSHISMRKAQRLALFAPLVELTSSANGTGRKKSWGNFLTESK